MNHYILTSNGREHALNGIDAFTPQNAPSISEIAHSLSQINRFTGHCSRPYSVAEHSLLVATIAKRLGLSPIGQLAALMHDAHECIVGDMASPIKAVMSDKWNNFEGDHQVNLLNKFGLTYTFDFEYDTIKQADLIALATERRDLMVYDPTKNRPWPIIDTRGAVMEPDATDLNSDGRNKASWRFWRALFKLRFKELSALAHLTTADSLKISATKVGV